MLNDHLKTFRRKKVKKVLHLYVKRGFKRILFTDEKVFTVGQKFNWQNDRIYTWLPIVAKTKDTPIPHSHHLASIMVW